MAGTVKVLFSQSVNVQIILGDDILCSSMVCHGGLYKYRNRDVEGVKK